MTVEDYDGILSARAANVLRETLLGLDSDTVDELGINPVLDGYSVKNVTTGIVDGVVLSKAQIEAVQEAEREKLQIDEQPVARNGNGSRRR